MRMLMSRRLSVAITRCWELCEILFRARQTMLQLQDSPFRLPDRTILRIEVRMGKSLRKQRLLMRERLKRARTSLKQDGVLICFHDVTLDDTIDIAQHKEFADRKRTYDVQGVNMTGFFTVEFTLKELKRLRVKQRYPFCDQQYNDPRILLQLKLQPPCLTHRQIYYHHLQRVHRDSFGCQENHWDIRIQF